MAFLIRSAYVTIHITSALISFQILVCSCIILIITQVFAPSVSVWKLTDTACTLVDATHSRKTSADETGRTKKKFRRIFMGLGRKADSSDKLVYQVAFSPDSEYIAGLSIDGSAYIWKARTLALARPLNAKNLAPLWQHSEAPSSRGNPLTLISPLSSLLTLC